MAADVEWVTGVIRFGAEFKKFGDPYQMSATVIRRGNEAEIIGCSGVVYPRLIPDLCDALRSHGVKKILWDRIRKNGTIKRVEINT